MLALCFSYCSFQYCSLLFVQGKVR